MQQQSSPPARIARSSPPERRLRAVEVRKTLSVTPHMQRITLTSIGLMGFPVRRPAQWVELFVQSLEIEELDGRAYTIRHFREDMCENDIDFVLHGNGCCSTWTASAKPGDIIQIASPRSGFRIDPALTHLLIGGDESALPAIGAILEALPPGLVVDVFVEIPEYADVQIIHSKADVEITWLPRNGREVGTATELAAAMMTANLPEDHSEVWFAAEAFTVRTVRRHFQLNRVMPPRRLTMSGYWKKRETDFRDREGHQ